MGKKKATIEELMRNKKIEPVERLPDYYRSPLDKVCPDCGRPLRAVIDTQYGTLLLVCITLVNGETGCNHVERVPVRCSVCAREMVYVAGRGVFVCSGITEQKHRCTNTVSTEDFFRGELLLCPVCGRRMQKTHYDTMVQCTGHGRSFNPCNTIFSYMKNGEMYF